MAINYDAPSNTITVTGYSELTPCDFTDLYNADVAGGWGVVSRQCVNQFCFNCKMQIGDGSTATWFADTKKQITFLAGSVGAAGGICIKPMPNSNFRLGKLINDSNKETRDGCLILDNNTYSYHGAIWDSVAGASYLLELYATSWIGSDNRSVFYLSKTSTLSKIYNCTFSNGVELTAGRCNLFNISLIKADYGLRRLLGINVDKITVMDITAPFYTYITGETTGIFSNVKIRHCAYAFSIGNSTTLSQTFINPDIDNWNIQYVGTSTAKLYRNYEFDLKVTDKDGNNINGASVKIWDKDDTLIVDTTTSSGVITEQTITRGYNNQANGNTLQDASPHILEIKKAGYQTYTKKFTMKKIDWTIRLIHTSVNPDQEAF